MRKDNYFKKMTDAMYLSNDTEIYYILIPYKMILTNTLKINSILFLIQVLTLNIFVFFMLTPVYLILLYVFYQLFSVLRKFEFKSFLIILWFVVSNIPTFLVSDLIKFIVFDILL